MATDEASLKGSNLFIDFLGDQRDSTFRDFSKRTENLQYSSESSSTKGEGSYHSNLNDPKEMKRLAAKSKRAEVRNRLNWKRARKQAEKKKEAEDDEIPV